MKPFETETLICMLVSHFVKYVIIEGILYGKFDASISGLSFCEYLEVDRSNVYDLLGY